MDGIDMNVHFFYKACASFLPLFDIHKRFWALSVEILAWQHFFFSDAIAKKFHDAFLDLPKNQGRHVRGFIFLKIIVQMCVALLQVDRIREKGWIESPDINVTELWVKVQGDQNQVVVCDGHWTYDNRH